MAYGQNASSCDALSSFANLLQRAYISFRKGVDYFEIFG